MTDAGIRDAGRNDPYTTTAPSETRLSAEAVRELHDRYAADLLAFLTGVLRDVNLAGDAFQATFQRVLESGHTANEQSLKGWLY